MRLITESRALSPERADSTTLLFKIRIEKLIDVIGELLIPTL